MSVSGLLKRVFGKENAPKETVAILQFEPPLTKEGEKVYANAAFMRARLKEHRAINADDVFALRRSFEGLSGLAGDSRYHPVGRLVLHELYEKGVPKEWAEQVRAAQTRIIQVLARTGKFEEVRRKFDVEDVRKWDGVLRAYVKAISLAAFAPKKGEAEPEQLVVESERQLAWAIDQCARVLLPRLVVRLQDDANRVGNASERFSRSGRVRQKLYGQARKAVQFGQFQLAAFQQMRNPLTKRDALRKLQGVAENKDTISVARLEMFYPAWESFRAVEPSKFKPVSVRPETLIQRWHQGVAMLMRGEECKYIETTERLIQAQLDSLLKRLREELARLRVGKAA